MLPFSELADMTGRTGLRRFRCIPDKCVGVPLVPVGFVYEKAFESDSATGSRAPDADSGQRPVLFVSLRFVTTAGAVLSVSPIFADEDVLSTKHRITVCLFPVAQSLCCGAVVGVCRILGRVRNCTFPPFVAQDWTLFTVRNDWMIRFCGARWA
jgi:hypothetical protein